MLPKSAKRPSKIRIANRELPGYINDSSEKKSVGCNFRFW